MRWRGESDGRTTGHADGREGDGGREWGGGDREERRNRIGRPRDTMARAGGGNARTVDGNGGARNDKKRKCRSDERRKRRKGATTTHATVIDAETEDMLQTMITMKNDTGGKPRVSKELPSSSASGAEDAEERGLRGGADAPEWDQKFEGQCFGAWKKVEIQQLREAIERWASEFGFLAEHRAGNFDFLFNRRQKLSEKNAETTNPSERRAFLDLARDVPTRNAKQIYGWVLRNMKSNTASGKWTPEETKTLLDLYDKYGKKWSKISTFIGRPASACRDKWRLVKGGKDRNTGRWSEEETSRLVALVKDYFKRTGTQAGRGPGAGNEHLGLLDNINWVSISQKLGTRNEQSCMQRWYQLAPSIAQGNRWSEAEDIQMLKNIIGQRPPTAEGVDWASVATKKTLSEIKRRWKTLSSNVRGYVDMPFPELVHQISLSYESNELIIAAESMKNELASKKP